MKDVQSLFEAVEKNAANIQAIMSAIRSDVDLLIKYIEKISKLTSEPPSVAG